MCPDTKKPKSHHDDDAALFRRAAGKIRRLKSDRVHHPRKPARAATGNPEAEIRPQRDMMSDAPGAEPAQGALFYASPGVRRKTIRQLKRGQLRIEDEIDLHGMRVAEAANALSRFLAECADRDFRCVRVIHGKGLSTGGSVIKQSVNRWLKMRDDVLAFCSAQPKDGGTGAVYVLLKR